VVADALVSECMSRDCDGGDDGWAGRASVIPSNEQPKPKQTVEDSIEVPNSVESAQNLYECEQQIDCCKLVFKGKPHQTYSMAHAFLSPIAELRP